MKRGSLPMRPTTVIVASTARQADMVADEFNLHRWRYAATLSNLAGVKADQIILVTPPLSDSPGYWLMVEEVHRLEARDGVKARRVTT